MALRLGLQDCKNYLLLHSALKNVLYFQYNPRMFALRTRLIRKYVRNSTRDKCKGGARAFSVTKRPRYYFPRGVGRTACKMFLLELKSFFQCFFLLNLFKNLNLCTSYIKQIMTVSHSCNWTNKFHLVKDDMYHSTRLRLIEWNISSFTSPHENICTIGLINIYYLHNILKNKTQNKTKQNKTKQNKKQNKNIFEY